MYSSFKVGDRVINTKDLVIYRVIAVRHITYESKVAHSMNVYLYVGKGKYINSKDCVLFHKKKNR